MVNFSEPSLNYESFVRNTRSAGNGLVTDFHDVGAKRPLKEGMVHKIESEQIFGFASSFTGRKDFPEKVANCHAVISSQASNLIVDFRFVIW
jgi:hypothetical protein